jgi:hypothetical protein
MALRRRVGFAASLTSDPDQFDISGMHPVC